MNDLANGRKLERSKIKSQICDEFSQYQKTNGLSKEGHMQELSQKNKQTWRYILSVFDPIKDLPESKRSTKTSRWENKCKPYQRKPLAQNSSRLNLTRRTNTCLLSTEPRPIQKKDFETANICRQRSSIQTEQENCNFLRDNFSESEIVWSSSGDECDDGVSSRRSISKSKSFGDASESVIVWSSSKESDDDGRTTSCRKKRTAMDPERDLNLFIQAIEKDFRRAKNIQERLSKKKGGYLEKSTEAIRKATACVRFLDYEHRTGILKGVIGVITKKEQSYGVCRANVNLEDGSQCCFVLNKFIRSGNFENSLVSFVDNSNCFVVDGLNTFVQPNKIIGS